MLRRTFYLAFIALLLGVLVYFYVQVNQHSEVADEVDLIEILPNNAGLILECSRLSNLTENKHFSSEMWASMLAFPALASYVNVWQRWDSLSVKNSELNAWSRHPAILSFHLIGKKAQPFFAVEFGNKATERAWRALLQSEIQEEKEYNNTKIYKFDKDFAQYCYFYNNYFAVSSNPILLEQSIRAIREPNSLDEASLSLRKTKGSDADVNIYVNYKRLHLMMSQMASSKAEFTSRLTNLGEWGEYDYSVDASKLVFNGFSNYQAEDYWHIFSNQESVKMTIQKVIPAAGKGFINFAFSHVDHFRQDYENHLKSQDNLSPYQEWNDRAKTLSGNDLRQLFDGLLEHEIAYCFDDAQTQADESLVIIKTRSTATTTEQMTHMLSTYASKRGKTINDFQSLLSIDAETSYPLYAYPFHESFSVLFGRAFDDFSARYFCLYDNFLIFGAQKAAIKKALVHNILKQTLSNDPGFMSIYAGFSDKSTLFYFEDIANVLSALHQNFGKAFCKKHRLNAANTGHFQALAYQMLPSEKYVYNSILLNFNAELKDKPQTVWSSRLEAAPVGKPTFVKNHNTQETEICVRDEKHNLYLISNSGRIIWKKPIGEPILGDIHQIDYYQNNKLQLLFNTSSKLWLLDRNGNFVERYPVALPSPASTGLSLFDYDKNKNYRIFVPTGNKRIYLYGKEGNINPDFVFKTTEYPLTRPIQHFRVNAKDYLVFADKNRVYVLNRKGERRIRPDKQFSASPENDFYWAAGEAPGFATTDVEGNLMKITLEGQVSKVKLSSAGAQHYFALVDLEKHNSNNIVIVDKDCLKVYNTRGRELYTKRWEKAELSRPYFYRFTSSDVKIGLVNNNEIYLLNGQDGKLYKDFPLIGTTPFSIGFLSASGWRFNLVVGGEDHALYNYRVK